MQTEMVEVIDSRGRTLTPCRRKVADREVRLNRAKWIGKNRIRLRFDPFAYRYIRLKVLERDKNTCYWCGGPGHTMDHVIPWSKGGRTTMTNCICACEECNGQRGDMDAAEFARRCNVAPPRPEMGQRPIPPSEGALAPALPAPVPVRAAVPALAPQPAQTKLQLVEVAVTNRRALHALLDPAVGVVSRRLYY